MSDSPSVISKINENLLNIKNMITDYLKLPNTTGNNTDPSFASLFFENPIIEDRPDPISEKLLSMVKGSRAFISNNREQIGSILGKLIGLTVSAAVTYFLFKLMMKNIDPTNADKLNAKSRAEKIMKDIGLNNLNLNEYEMFIASNIVMPNNIDCSWQDIGGLDHIIGDLRETVIYPLKNFEENSIFNNMSQASNSLISRRSRLIQPPKGVLLFGPPGNAKTMIAKSLAKESGARFINLQVSTLFDKWYGESQKRTEAIFSLAEKVQPVIIFIDEIGNFYFKN